ncbi:Ig-like domain-containing protein [Aliikangiella maris]|uniref:Ig-like domain-containing protein n=2 Tax=Aliikangiella maris TaxID=3162458 RepID=A0ABV2BXV6_9GAMM
MHKLIRSNLKHACTAVGLSMLIMVSGCYKDDEDVESNNIAEEVTDEVTKDVITSIKVLESIPSNNALDVKINTPISIKYDKAINSNDLDITFIMKAGDQTVEGTYQVESDTLRFYPHNALNAGTAYDIEVTGSILDKPLQTANIHFTTIENTTVSVTKTVPAPSSSSIAIDTSITVEFDTVVDSSSGINLQIIVNQGSNRVSGQTQITDNKLIFKPTNNLAFGTEVSVRVDDASGSQKAVNEFSWKFVTVSEAGICANFYEENFQLVSGLNATEKTYSSKPAKGVEIKDPTFNTCIVRMTDHKNEPSSGFARAEYSRKQAFNANNTRILALAYDGHWHTYDANTGEYQIKLEGPASDSEVRWHATNPDLIYYTGIYGIGLKVNELNVKTNESRVVGDFNNRLPWSNAVSAWTKAEGTSSADGRYLGLQVEDAKFNPLGLMVWDSQTDTIVGTWDFEKHGVGRPDHTSMSPSGEYIVASWDGNSYGTTAFSRDFSKQVKLHTKSEHSDLALLPNGNDAYVAVDYQSNSGEVFMVEIQTGIRTKLFDSYVKGSATAFHFSGKAFDKPGWALVSTYGGTSTSDGSKVWMHDKVFAVELKANPKFFHLAHHHSVANGYWTEPHATVNRDFTRVAFNSNWEVDSANDIDIYQVRIPADALDGEGSSEDPKPVPTTELINKTLENQPTNILFVGNSLTGHFEIPTLFKKMTEEKGYNLVVDTEIYGGNSFEDHYFRAQTREKIQNGSFDTVVLQGSSYGPIYHLDKFFSFGGLLSDLVVESGKTPVYYMTWHHQEDLETEAKLIKANYLQLANTKGQTVNPVGYAFEKVARNHSNISLYSDNTHQSYAGAYLSAVMFYSFLLQEDPTLLAFTGELDSATADVLKSVAKETLIEFNGIQF